MNINLLNFSFVIPQKLAGMAWPEKMQPVTDTVAYLKSQSVVTLVNATTDNYKNPLFAEEFNLLHVPTSNMAAPTDAQMDSIIEAYANLKENEVMAVHCLYGVGRTGLVLACLLGKVNNMDAEEAVYTIRQLRTGSIESEQQKQFVSQYLAN